MDAVLSVSDFLKLANEVLRLNIQGSAFAIEGEVSGFKIVNGRWPSFTLKDEQHDEFQLACFAFHEIGVVEDGMRVRIWGAATVSKWSKFQLTVERVEPVGEGAFKRAYEALKKKLELEGLFDVARKRALPRFPKRIGLITSGDAAAYGDFLRILNNRWGGVVVEHANVHVQGKEAVDEILAAFQALNAPTRNVRPDVTGQCDVIVLTRGGGSLEDLHAFNDEHVARAVYASVIPVVCGVGHERDESLCDYVADVRASTPSNAAERVVPNREDVLFELQMTSRMMEERLLGCVNEKKTVLENLARVMTHQVHRQKIHLEAITQALKDQTARWIATLKTRIESSTRLLTNLDPTRILSRGYAIASANGQVVKDVSTLELGSDLTVQFAKGSVETTVKCKR